MPPRGVPAPAAATPAAAVQAIAEGLERELQWLARVIDARFHQHFGTPAPGAPGTPPTAAPGRDAEPLVATLAHLAAPAAMPDAPAPAKASAPAAGRPAQPAAATTPLAGLLAHYGAGLPERLALALALAPHLRPQLLDVFHTRNETFARSFTEFGGQRDANGDFLPTGETLLFLWAGTDLAQRLALQPLFDREHWFARHHVLTLEAPERALSPHKGVLRLSADALAWITTGQPHRPALGLEFPAQPISTALDWADLVLHPATRAQVDEIGLWLRHGARLRAEPGLGARLRPGLRVLFHGPPGTGKTLTAALLGRTHGREVYRVDLSLVVSKYIGETEKNLGRVFDQAEHKGWILFFDEADALFGKRSESRDAHDRYANQEVAYLLQRIEGFDGIAVLATNLRDHLDPAFARRFEATVYFPVPRPEERLALWRSSLPASMALAADIDLAQVAQQHALGGGAIVNVARHVALWALARGDGTIRADDLARGIARELAKDGRGP